MAILGVLARKESMRKHAIHGALVFALFGLLGSLMGAKGWIAFATGVSPELKRSHQEMLVMFVICLVYLVLGIRSFIAARKARTA